MATLRGRSYYSITRALRLMNLQYDSLSPQEAAASNAKVIITTRDEADGIIMTTGKRREGILLDTDLEKFPAVAKAAILRSIAGAYADDQLVIGIDPGSRIGLSAIYLHQEIASEVESSPKDAADHVCAMLGGIDSKRKIVRIGDGDIAMAGQIARVVKARFRDTVQVEIVDEHGTSLPQNTDANRRGLRDRSSARTIAFRTGKAYYPSYYRNNGGNGAK